MTLRLVTAFIALGFLLSAVPAAAQNKGEQGSAVREELEIIEDDRKAPGKPTTITIKEGSDLKAFKAAVKKQAGKKAAADAKLAAAFAKLDKNKNGKLDKAELKAARTFYGDILINGEPIDIE